MGYANDTLVNSEWKPVCSQFLKIGSKDGSDMKLSELVPGGGWGYGTDLIKVFKTTSAVDFNAVYYTWDSLTKKQQKGRDKETFIEGWYKTTDEGVDLDNDCMNETPLPFGTCVLVQSATTGAYITSNGEVAQTEDSKIVVELVNSEWKFVGNCTPVARTLKDFVPGNGWGYGTDLIKVFKTTSAVDFNAVYYTWDSLTKKQQKGRDKETFIEGWYKTTDEGVDLDNDCVNSTPIVAGAGFLAQSATTGATITQPSAL